jgi:hypothetical protein
VLLSPRDLAESSASLYAQVGFSTPNGCSATNGFSAGSVSGDRHAEKWNFDCVVLKEEENV